MFKLPQRFQFSRFRAIVKKEFLQIRRDRASLMIAILMPILMLFLFGYAVNTDVDHLPTGVWDQAKTQASRELIREFINTKYFDQTYSVEGYSDLQKLMDQGKIKVGIVIPRDFSYKLDTGDVAKVQVLVDGSDPNAARTAVADAQLIIQNKAITLQENLLHAEGITSTSIPLKTEIRVLYNPNMKSLIFNVPALIGLIMQNVTVILTAFALVREKERGTMEQLIVTPVRPSELIVGKLVPYIGIGLFSFTLVLVTGIWWFGVPVAGSVSLLILLSLLFLVTTLAIGILISTVAKTQLQAMQLAFAFILPSVLLSGFMFPRETMPLVIQWIGGIIPLTYFLQILRGIFLKGIGIDALWHETFSLVGFAFLFCLLAITRFKKKLE